MVEPEAKGAGAARVAAGDLPVVVAGVVLERLAAERAAVLGGHAAKVAEAEGAAVHFEALHHEVVVCWARQEGGGGSGGVRARAALAVGGPLIRRQQEGGERLAARRSP